MSTSTTHEEPGKIEHMEHYQQHPAKILAFFQQRQVEERKAVIRSVLYGGDPMVLWPGMKPRPPIKSTTHQLAVQTNFTRPPPPIPHQPVHFHHQQRSFSGRPSGGLNRPRVFSAPPAYRRSVWSHDQLESRSIREVRASNWQVDQQKSRQNEQRDSVTEVAAVRELRTARRISHSQLLIRTTNAVSNWCRVDEDQFLRCIDRLVEQGVVKRNRNVHGIMMYVFMDRTRSSC